MTIKQLTITLMVSLMIFMAFMLGQIYEHQSEIICDNVEFHDIDYAVCNNGVRVTLVD